ncbi:MAG TPA: carboxypeptidase-like regulatory domain-containing protein, partial [Streptosporangiaceae bacterium]|nr:carboxypeptidase-like regulatory domain-containing protein [Streptosporangiaceae bacterium]
AHGVPAAAAARVSHLPPTAALFAAFLGYNPMQTLLGPVLAHLPHATVTYLTGRGFFPRLISPPFMDGLGEAFDFAAAACAVAAVASWLRGGKYYYTEPEPAAPGEPQLAVAPGATAPRAPQAAAGRNITGTVREAGSGAGVPGAAVTATDSAGQVTAHVVTGPGGGYRLPGLPAGRYTVAAAAPGYRAAARRAELNGVAEHGFDLLLTREL